MSFLYRDKVKKMKCPFCKKKTLKYIDDKSFSLIVNQPNDNALKIENDLVGGFGITTRPVYLIFCQFCGHTQIFLKEKGNSSENEIAEYKAEYYKNNKEKIDKQRLIKSIKEENEHEHK